MRTSQKTGTLAILSILAAILAMILIFSGSPVWGLLLAIVSIPLGIIGLLMAASPRVSGGIISIFGIILGALGLVLAILAMVGMIIF